MHSAIRRASRWASVGLCAALLVGAAAGCGRNQAPAPLSSAELKTTVTGAFKDAKPEVRKLADMALESFQKKNFPEASAQVQAICSVPDLSAAQRTVATRFLMSINTELQTAVSQGDAAAESALKTIRTSK